MFMICMQIKKAKADAEREEERKEEERFEASKGALKEIQEKRGKERELIVIALLRSPENSEEKKEMNALNTRINQRAKVSFHMQAIA